MCSTVFTPEFVSCSHSCLGYIWCISINYEYNADPVGACELNSRGVLDPSHGKRADLVSKDNYVFSQLRSDKVRFILCDNVLERYNIEEGPQMEARQFFDFILSSCLIYSFLVYSMISCLILFEVFYFHIFHLVILFQSVI